MYAFKADLTIKEDIDELVREIMEKLGPVEILAYNTGPPRPGTFNELNDADWDYGVKLLLMSAVRLARRVIPGMEQKRRGRLVFIGSTTLRQPVPNLVLSNTVRLSLAGLSKSLATEYGAKGITSNRIMQGRILTERAEKDRRGRLIKNGKGHRRSEETAAS